MIFLIQSTTYLNHFADPRLPFENYQPLSFSADAPGDAAISPLK